MGGGDVVGRSYRGLHYKNELGLRGQDVAFLRYISLFMYLSLDRLL